MTSEVGLMSQLDVTHRNCSSTPIMYTSCTYLYIDQYFTFSLNEGDGREVGKYGDTEGLGEGALGLHERVEGLEESRILHSVTSRAG